MRTLLALTALAAALISAPAAEAGLVTYAATLSGAAENPPVTTSGYGQVLVEYDDLARTLRVAASFADLTGTTTASHIHCCAATPTVNAGVATQVPSFVGFPLGVTSGVFDNTYDLTLASSWNPAFITANGGTTAGAEARLAQGLADGQAYFNVHTTFAPGGEIRGNLAAVPEPGSLALAALALGAAGVARRRRA